MADESQGKPAIPVFFASYAIDIDANEFQPTNNLPVIRTINILDRTSLKGITSP